MQFLKTKNKSALAITGLGLVVIIAALWLEENKNAPVTAVSSPAPENQLDYFMTKYNIISINAEGEAFRWLSGNRLEYFTSGDTHLGSPKFQFSQKSQHWLLTAKDGNLIEDEKITLDGEVTIQQLNGKTKALSIETNHLDISLSDNIAATESEVLVSDENGKINATGMHINFDNHQLRLLSNVKGRYNFE